MAKDAAYVIALTGTPLPNAYTDVYNLLHILFPYEYDEFFGFTPAQLRKPAAQDMQAVNDKLKPFYRTFGGFARFRAIFADEKNALPLSFSKLLCYNLPDKRLHLIEKEIQKRASVLLK